MKRRTFLQMAIGAVISPALPKLHSGGIVSLSGRQCAKLIQYGRAYGAGEVILSKRFSQIDYSELEYRVLANIKGKHEN